jgi:hypothetical protein
VSGFLKEHLKACGTAQVILVLRAAQLEVSLPRQPLAA